MDWRRLFVLTVVFACASCTEYQDLPIQLYVDEDFSEIEQQAIADAVAEWNEWAGGRYAHGDEVFEIVGTHDDTFNMHDYEDGRHSIYRITEPVPDEQWLQDLYNGIDGSGLGGYCPLSDCILVMYPIDEHLEQRRAEYLTAIAAGEMEPLNVTRYIRDRRYGMTHNLVLHELGHMLGLMHINNRLAIMNSKGPNIYRGVEHVTDADLDAFCMIYDCNCSCVQEYD